jgi:DNA primase
LIGEGVAKQGDSWDKGREVYSPLQVETVLREAGIEVREETVNDFLSLCPFHGNDDSPAFSTSKTSGYSLCFNPTCGVGTDPKEPALSLERLVGKVKHLSRIEAKRFILLRKDASVSFQDQFDSIKVEDIELKEFSSEAIDMMHQRLLQTPEAIDYLKGRGLERETVGFFKVGFAPAATGNVPIYRPHDMIMVPAYDHKSKPVGLVGRSLVGKEFKNYGPDPGGRGFHKSKIVWNLNNARKFDTCIITEATFDSMRVHQAGYPNVAALLGGTLSREQEGLLKRHFTRIIIMTDNETGDDKTYHRMCRKCLNQGHEYCQGHQPGRDLGMQLVERLPDIRISWAVYDERNVYARNVKDASAMTDHEIQVCLRNAIPHYDYLDWVA